MHSYLILTYTSQTHTQYPAQIFEKGKAELGGIHFLAVQTSEESEEVEGFFLLRERKK
jgi:hypothetical protein